MDKVFTSLAVSVDGFITGRDPAPGHGLGDGGILFGWYGDGDTPSQIFPGFRLFEPSRSVVDDGAAHRGQPPPGATRGVTAALRAGMPAPGVTHLRYRIER